MKSFLIYLRAILSWIRINTIYAFTKNDKKYVAKKFKQYHKYDLNFENPEHYDEKISINKFSDDSEFKKRLSDKNAVRGYIKEIGLERILIKPFYVYDSIKDIDFSIFKEPVILKCNNTSGIAYKYYPGNKVDKWRLKTLSFLNKQNYYKVFREKNYDKIDRKIIAERILNDPSGELIDYKFFCFDGKIEFISLEHNVSKEDGQHSEDFKRNILDRNFKTIEGVKETRDPVDMSLIKKPDNWDDMCEVAEKISSGINSVRVDLYSVNGKTYFGETTFYHGAGFNKFEPESFDKMLGSKIEIFKK